MEIRLGDEGLSAGEWFITCMFAVCFLQAGCMTEFGQKKQICGNGIVEGEEVCDGDDLRGETCESLGLEDGVLKCRTNCFGFDATNCTAASECGNGVLQAGEACDGDDHGDETCVTMGYDGGVLGCQSDCTNFDDSNCEGPGPVCGDGIRQGLEVCDDGILAGEACETQGFYNGILRCLPDCSGFDTSECWGYCGDEIKNEEELCDGADLGSVDCESLGFGGGTPECLPDCAGYDTSGCVTWVLIAGGTFNMGSENGYSNETPVHTVAVNDFEMTESQITVKQYAMCVDRGICTEPSTYHSTCNWNQTGYSRHPVNCVNWVQAGTYCSWIGGRLPSESEWEYAAKSGGQDVMYPWGNDVATCDVAVMGEVESGCGTGRTWEVCSRPLGNTDQGLCDMAGNVWEWVRDWYNINYEGAPDDGSSWEEPEGIYRVSRGGGFSNDHDHLRTTYRGFFDPYLHYISRGFRCAKSGH